jgi:predicted nucleic acid-binding protein
VTIVDTDVLIDAGRGAPEAIGYLASSEQKTSLAISMVTKMELIVGCRNRAELRNLERVLVRFRLLQLNEAISDRAVELLRQYRLSHGLLIADALIAATVMEHIASLVSKNQKDYRFISGLALLPYP